MKRIIYQLHLWPGLVSGLLVFIIALTGALYAFQDEISSLYSYRYSTVEAKPYLPPSKLQQIAEQQLPGKELHAVKLNAPGKAAEAIFYGYNPEYYYIVYLNPYNGQVQQVKNMNRDFFRFVMQGHFYLWLPPAIGQPIVAWSTLVFFILIVTGLILWIPKNKKVLKNRVAFRWKKGTNLTRKNLDLHVVGGLYVSVFALLFATTGLVWGFQWWANGMYKAVGGQKPTVYSDINPHKTVPDTLQIEQPLDSVWRLMHREYPDAAWIEVHPPHTDSTMIAANATRPDGKYWSTDYRYFDTHSLKEVSVNHLYGRLSDMNRGEKLFRMNYEIHTGSILGLPGKILAFLMSLFIASLPVTGIILWWRKQKKR